MVKERDIKYFKQILRTMTDEQIHWVLNHDYPDWEKELAREEKERRNA